MNKKFNASKVKGMVVSMVCGACIINTVALTPFTLNKLNNQIELQDTKIQEQSKSLEEVKKELTNKKDELEKISNDNEELKKSLEDTKKSLDESKQREVKLENEKKSLEQRLKTLQTKQTKEKEVSKSSSKSRTKSSKTSVNKGRKITMSATAYHAGEPGNANGRTATGIKAQVYKTIAVDPRVIPLHSKVYLEFPTQPHRNGIYYAHDVGGGIKGNKIDLFVGGDSEARNFGVRKVYAYIQ